LTRFHNDDAPQEEDLLLLGYLNRVEEEIYPEPSTSTAMTMKYANVSGPATTLSRQTAEEEEEEETHYGTWDAFMAITSDASEDDDDDQDDVDNRSTASSDSNEHNSDSLDATIANDSHEPIVQGDL
ncbi:uncharacterized protein LOC112494859, partial [Cephus cinctus]|uniref:Uncharacterized protein LOC112494859 n=1 Tax=Cephus cinctus TaxID=211228 RepID=A0AAJ7RNB5_CEPCN